MKYQAVVTDYTFPDLGIEEAVLRPEGIEIVSFKEKRVDTWNFHLVSQMASPGVVCLFSI